MIEEAGSSAVSLYLYAVPDPLRHSGSGDSRCNRQSEIEIAMAPVGVEPTRPFRARGF